MINKYYTNNLLLVYLKEIQKVKKTKKRAILQKDDDFSHNIKRSDLNLTRNFKQKHDIKLLKHSPQSFDLNSHEDRRLLRHIKVTG